MFQPDAVFAAVALAAFLVGLSKGGVPTIGMLAVPLVSLVMSPLVAAVLLLPLYIVSDAVGVWLYRRQYSAPNLRILVPAGLLGVGLGWATASVLPEAALALLVGLVGLWFCLLAWWPRDMASHAQPPHVWKGGFWGVLAGLTSFVAHAGGPPYQLYMLPQRLPKLAYAGTTTLFFAAVNAAKLLPYQHLQPYTLESLWRILAWVPFALLGTVAGAWLTRRLADAWFFRLVQISLFAVSLKLVWDASHELLPGLWGG